jgi:hypothetical protein
MAHDKCIAHLANIHFDGQQIIDSENRRLTGRLFNALVS